MKKDRFLYLFRRYKNNEASEEENRELIRMVDSGMYDEWIKQHIEMLLEGDRLQDAEMDTDMSEKTATGILQNILKKESAGSSERILALPATVPKHSILSNWKWVAAAIVVMVGVFWLNMDLLTSGDGTAVTQEKVMQEVITKKGERTSLTLGDGSRVTLNADSKLLISQDFNRANRTLILQGEAFFEVESNPVLPFIVYTDDDIYTEALGTQFNVRSYETAQMQDDRMAGVNVVVSEGRVRLGNFNVNQTNSVVVNAGQKGEIDAHGSIGVSDVSDLDMYLGWVAGRLIFEDHPFEQVITELERWYDIEITVTDSGLLQRRLSAVFEGDPLSVVLQVVAQSLQIHVARDGQRVQFSPHEHGR